MSEKPKVFACENCLDSGDEEINAADGHIVITNPEDEDEVYYDRNFCDRCMSLFRFNHEGVCDVADPPVNEALLDACRAALRVMQSAVNAGAVIDKDDFTRIEWAIQRAERKIPINANPDLLKALKQLTNYTLNNDGTYDKGELLDQAFCAIAKAEGKETVPKPVVTDQKIPIGHVLAEFGGEDAREKAEAKAKKLREMGAYRAVGVCRAEEVAYKPRFMDSNEVIEWVVYGESL